MRQYTTPLLLTILIAGCDSSAVSPTSKTKLDGKTQSPVSVSPSKVQVGVRQITFDDLNIRKLLNVDEVIWDIHEALPESLSQLDGKRVRIRGWIEPPGDMGIEQRAFFLFSKKPELEYARIKYPVIEPAAEGDDTPETYVLESISNVEVLDLSAEAGLDVPLEILTGREPRWWGQADETIHVRLRTGASLKNARKRSVDVVGDLKVGGISDCPPARWIYVLKDAEVFEIPDTE